MATLTLTTFMTLDGVMQAPGGPEEDRTDGFVYGGWSVPFADEDFGSFMDEVFGRVDAFLLGRRTYEIFASYWPKVTDENDPIASRLNALPKYVVSRTLEKADWNNSTVIGGDLTEEVNRLKERSGREVQVHGSARLAQSLIALGLVDELNLLVFPVFLGKGRRLFPDGGAPTAFALTGHRTTSTGVTIQTYRPTGPAQFGTFALDE
ncbi:dihydrofolate reductase [Streptomyces sp. WAC05374]|uniref:dihydrofolate reductase family protein n=1 Tax=Streptomyces sp. WAC05374 TaxID=2487420 RepID=UPI000F896473|nr:dihydrofolate reductase family protein [Streptomyces sp. WAC05374]RST11185.1 dihydrofolate reductase [Streptomyces sp. WAC05374]TDF46178.1 dihydrofolate reductase [Streptomyces sp. WAC05374]TDF52424.1 dihydrofolate reductase [Streptomyces sp. WAC05374]TDF58385.1 dihydrofolate reductase [Streptomyces sp. WAC05374]